MTDPRKMKASDVEPDMLVEATEGDIGEADFSKPKVAKVTQDEAGNLKNIVVKKGVIFQKEIEIPADRIEKVISKDETENTDSKGKVIISASELETETLAPTGSESLVNENILGEVEQAIPTAEGLRKLEQQAATVDQIKSAPETSKKVNLLKILGPGFLGGMAGNDSSAVTSYSVDGATNGYGHLWLLLISTPLYQAVQYTCAKVGRVSQKGLAEILREHYGRPIAGVAALILIVANLALIAADLLAIGTGLELITGINWIWFVIPVTAFLWYIIVFKNFESIKKTLLF